MQKNFKKKEIKKTLKKWHLIKQRPNQQQKCEIFAQNGQRDKQNQHTQQQKKHKITQSQKKMTKKDGK